MVSRRHSRSETGGRAQPWRDTIGSSNRLEPYYYKDYLANGVHLTLLDANVQLAIQAADLYCMPPKAFNKTNEKPRNLLLRRPMK